MLLRPYGRARRPVKSINSAVATAGGGHVYRAPTANILFRDRETRVPVKRQKNYFYNDYFSPTSTPASRSIFVRDDIHIIIIIIKLYYFKRVINNYNLLFYMLAAAFVRK